ncbi:MAG TPA: hypothetical protein V6C97_01050 [Oculatellaceae cyanobacterium]
MTTDQEYKSALHRLIGLVRWIADDEEEYRNTLHQLVDEGDIQMLLDQLCDEIEQREAPWNDELPFIAFDALGNLVECSRCHQHEDGSQERAWTLFYEENMPVAALCDACYMELEQSGLLQEKDGILRLHDD